MTPRTALSAITERLAIGLTLAMILLMPGLLVLRVKARVYAVLDRAYPELALRLLRQELAKNQLHSMRYQRRGSNEPVPAR